MAKIQMTLRWFGKDHDTVTLRQIRQIPGVKGIISTLFDIPPGEIWPKERIRLLAQEAESEGLTVAGIESLNIHDSIKDGSRERDRCIENYRISLKNLGESGIRLVCYNFMPVFDWTRTELARLRPDGSTVMAYDQEIIDATDGTDMFSRMDGESGGFALPGWEPERLKRIRELFDIYRTMDDGTLLKNLQYFLEAILPVCETYGIRMALHPDDPAWPVFGLPRIVNTSDSLRKILDLSDSHLHGLTFCTGSLGSDPSNDLPGMIHRFKDRIHFAHIRNLKYVGPGKFEESAHLSEDGSLDMFAVIKALYETGFTGPIRPDHGRTVWNEKALPGYGLYDRAMGAVYLQGLWEAVSRMSGDHYE